MRPWRPYDVAVRKVGAGLILGLVMMLAPVAEAAAAADDGAAWLPTWVSEAAVSVVEANSDLFETASPFWYDATGCASVVVRAGGESRGQLARLRATGTRVVPTVTATGLMPAAAIRCFSDGRRRAAHVRLLRDLAREWAYDGLDLDYEHLALTTDVDRARRVRAAFSAFVSDLCAGLRRDGRVCSVTVMPRTSDRAQVWRGKLLPFVYDYAHLGRVSDELRVMAYDQHAGRFGPGPIAGMPWVQRVADYVASQTPVSRVRLGVPTYGRDFSSGDSVSLTGDAARELARRHGATVRFDDRQQEATFTYVRRGVRHEVWFSNPRAVSQRVALARARGFRGPAYWAAGLEMSGTWRQVRG